MKKYIRFFLRNDIAVQIYISLIVLVTLTVTMVGAIFLHLYRKSYLDSYQAELLRQAETISDSVGQLARNGKEGRFAKYAMDIDELTAPSGTDVWIVSSPNARHPLGEDFINAEISSLTKDMYQVLNEAFDGRTAAKDSYDRVYGMMILRVAAPVYVDKARTEVGGAVMLVSMLQRQQIALRRGKYLIVLSTIFGLVVSYILAVWFSRSLARPIHRLRFEIVRMARGDYGEIKVEKKRSQFGKLETALNTLAGRLRRIVQERENLEQVRRDFFANVSHELRTPITVMRGYTESLADGVITDPEKVEEYYQRMLQECQGMERLVGDLFILSKMQNPDFQIEKEPVSLIMVFSDVVRNGNIIGREKDIELVTKFPENQPCLILGDYDRLRQMFLIIVDNAVKFSYEHSTIEITIKRKMEEKQTRLLISIEDHGVGISEEQLPYIFEKFYRSKLKQNEKGTGLGLMIAKQIALRHGGDISVKSVVGKGTVFSFVFTECSVEDAENQLG